MKRGECSWNRSWLLLDLIAFGSLFLLAILVVNGCGAARLGQSDFLESSAEDADDYTTYSTGSSVTTVTNTLPGAVPPELSQFHGLGERLLAQGVPVLELREMPNQDYGTGVEVVLSSTGTGQMATVEDAINTHLVFRAAVLEKMTGSEIEAVAVAFLKGDEVTVHSVVPIDRTIGEDWYETPGLPLQETTMRAHEYVLGSLAHLLYEADEFRVTEDPDGTRVLWARLVVTKTGLSEELIQEPFALFGEAVQALNERAPTKIGLVRLEICDAAGKPLLYSIGDLQLESATWWEAGKIRSGVYPRPGPSPPDTDSFLPEEMPPDFGFVAAYGPGGSNVLDTFAGTFTKDIINPSKPNPTVELRLTPEELAALYQDLVEMDILDYPPVFRPELEDTSGTMVSMSPHESYLLAIRARGMDKHVAWEDANQMQTPEAVALRDWFTRLRIMIEARPEYQAMPPVEGGYL